MKYTKHIKYTNEYDAYMRLYWDTVSGDLDKVNLWLQSVKILDVSFNNDRLIRAAASYGRLNVVLRLMEWYDGQLP